MADIKEVLVAWAAGTSVSAITRMLGYTRPTVRKYITAGQKLGLTRPAAQQRTDLEWEALARAVQERLAARRESGTVRAEVAHHHAYLQERVGTLPLSVLQQRLRNEQGLQASWGSFYRYVAAHWPERLRGAQQGTSRLTVRLADPAPGEEAQVDFFHVGRWTESQTGQTHRLSAFLMTLSHSRHQFLYPVLREDEASWLEAHVAAFTFFGGVPRRLVPDNLSAGILKADRYDPRVNRAYSELARYYGCLVDPARVGHPKDKPRVERTVPYARASFFGDRAFTSLEQMRRAAVDWALEVAGQRVHGTTGERPLEAFRAREQAALLPLPAAPWEVVSWTTATVQADCHLSVARARYSVPSRYVGQQLDVRLGAHLVAHLVAIYDGASLVTTHVRQTQGHATRLEHYPAAGQAFLRATPQVCLQQAQALGPATTTLVAPLLATRTLHHLREVQALLRLAERYDAARLETACSRALVAGDGRLRTVRGLLESGRDQQAPEPEAQAGPTTAVGAFLRGPAAFAPPLAAAAASVPVPVPEEEEGAAWLVR